MGGLWLYGHANDRTVGYIYKVGSAIGIDGNVTEHGNFFMAQAGQSLEEHQQLWPLRNGGGDIIAETAFSAAL